MVNASSGAAPGLDGGCMNNRYNFDKDVFRRRVIELVKLNSKVKIEDGKKIRVCAKCGKKI